MREIVRLIAEWLVMISGLAVLLILTVALCWKAVDVVFKTVCLFPIFLEFAEWRSRKHRGGDSDA